MKNERILIIGANGFVGSRIYDLALNQYHLAMGTYFNGNENYISEDKYIRLDVTDGDSVKATFLSTKPDVVIFAAGTRDIEFCENNPIIAYEVHVKGTQHIVNSSLSIGSRLIYISTDCVFNGEKEFFSESDIPDPRNIYGKVKLEAEQIILNSSLNSVIIRSSLLFGWSYQGQGINTVSYVIRSLRENIPVTLPTVLFNTPLYIRDAAKIILDLTATNLQGVFHLAGKSRVSRYKLGLDTAKIFNLDTSLVIPTERTSGIRPINSCLSNKKLQTSLNILIKDYLFGLRRMASENKRQPGLELQNDPNPSNSPGIFY